ncbi:MAG: DUF2784 domain-containing protein [Acidobacteria bacterium]|nr:DUF2784 domain-containing protein [Acidobacteriota bacterium]
MIYRLLADFVVALHVLWVTFVIIGFLIILMGWWRGWRIIGSFWLRTIHMAGIVIVVSLEWSGRNCPLTDLEKWLRAHHDPALTYLGGFIPHYGERLIYIDVPMIWIAVPTTLLTIAIILLYFLVPPRRPSRLTKRRRP